jgi:gliding motility-associated-like protein
MKNSQAIILFFLLPITSLFAQPDASFTFDISRLQTYSVRFNVTNHTMADTTAYLFEWDFGDGETGSYPLILHTYKTAGTYTVTLNVSDITAPAITSTFSANVFITDAFDVPNVFTPDGDGINDQFIVQSNGVTPITITIFNRAGTVVFKNTAPTVIWDGRTPSGDRARPGVYYYVITSDDELYNKTGFVHLFYGKDSR